MTITAGKVAPSIIVLAFVGYCAWPSVSSLVAVPATPQKAERLATFTASLFSPTLPPRPTKSPFGGLDAEAFAEARAAGRMGGTQKKVASAEKKVAPKVINPTENLRLEATSTSDDEQLTVINGKVYSTGQMLANDDDAAPPCKIVRILPNKVFLEFQGKTTELVYSNSVASTSAKKPAGDSKPGKNNFSFEAGR
jgi:hypothetical protein